MRRFTAVLALALSFGLLITACDSGLTGSEAPETPTPQASQQGPPENPGIQGLNAVRNATEEYKDISEAQADGYKLFSPFVPGMGFHYLHESIINEDGSSALDRRLNRTKPEILVYSDKTAGNSDQFAPHSEGFAAVEYAIPKGDGETEPPQHAVALFNNAGADDWHVHPSTEELPPSVVANIATIHAECHYKGGIGVFLAEDMNGNFVLFTPPTGAFGSWSGTVAPDQCPTMLGGNSLPELRIVHGKWWTLHAWIWVSNPEGIFHPTNPDVKQ